MDWEFEVAKGDDLSKLIGDGFTPNLGADALQAPEGIDWQVVLEAQSAGLGDAQMSSYSYSNGYDTGGGYDSGGGYYDPNYPPGGGDPNPDPDPDPEPLVQYDFNPDSPVGPVFDYTGLIDESLFTAWTVAPVEYQMPIGSWHYHDSLDQYMNGEWFIDIDPELLGDGNFGYDDRFGPGYIEYDQYTPINYFGVPGGSGLIPVFSEWTTTRDLGILPGQDISSFEVTHHTTFMGFQRSETYQVASLGDPFDFLGRLAGTMDAFDLQEAWEDFEEAMRGAPNTQAMGRPGTSTANGMLMAPVMLNGVKIGDVMVNDYGMRLFDANGRPISSPTPLPQHWNTLEGVMFKEQLAHQERTTGVPFASSLVGFASIAAPALGGTTFLSGLGFNFASDVVSGGSLASATAYARILEAAYELRAYELRNR